MNDEQTDDRPMFDATCADCAAETQVPFQPSGDRPVYCRDCFAKHRNENRGGGAGGGGSREWHDVTCADCGNATQVPFKPTGDRPVYCRDCFAKHKGE